QMIEELKQRQPVVMAYLLSDNFYLLTEQEKDMLLYFALVIRKSYQKTNDGQEPEAISEDEMGNAEEANWARLEDSSAKTFRERLDIFFADTPQEDLLAFFEDVLIDDEEEITTKAGREYIFVAAKSIVDIWC
ncbi:MAG: hypothetical protein ACPG5P_00360, partial [Saprospiraceae bacterium]